MASVIVQVVARYSPAAKNNNKRMLAINPPPEEGTVMRHVNSIIASGKNKK